ncbi:MAG: hypothetical protein COW54_13325 [Rhodobacteraceae bacterium CG17_big_fil_post_rev_8_21_14_2_50_63_15]|nr:MAG: hypothetical protein COW54_13325 [Rhodobacteraceae bacterium CG17_big_fil_post_rev_8_21_14_2_50_63_15]
MNASDFKKERKDSQLVIRIKKAERDAFVDLCDQLDSSAAREIRRFIREFALTYAVPAQIPADLPTVAEGLAEKRPKKKARHLKKKK